MIEMLKRALKECDFLSPSVVLYLDGNNRVKTKFGGLLCILLLIAAAVGFGWFFSRVLDYTDYVVTTNKIYEKFHNFQLNTDENVLTIKLDNKFVISISENTYSAFAQYWEFYYEKDQSGGARLKTKVSPLKMKRCGKDYKLKSKEFNDLYKDLDFSNMWCLESSQLINITNAYGGFSDFSFINFYVTYCTHRADCKNETVANKELDAYNFVSIMTNYFIDNTNYTTPLQPYLSSLVEPSSSSYYKRIDSKISTVDHISDVGLLLEEKRTISQMVQQSTLTSIDFRSDYINGGKVLLRYSIYFNPQGFKEIYYRNYKKIQTVLAEIGGFLNSIRIVVALTLVLYHQITFVHVIMKGFKFHTIEQLIPNKKQHKINNFFGVKEELPSDNNIHPDKNHIKISSNNTQYNSSKALNNNFCLNQNKLKINKLPTKCGILTNLICLKSRSNDLKLNMYVLVKQKLIRNYLSVKNLIKNNNEVSFLRSVLLKDKADNDLFSDYVRIISLNKDVKQMENYYFNPDETVNSEHLELPEDEQKLNILDSYLKSS